MSHSPTMILLLLFVIATLSLIYLVVPKKPKKFEEALNLPPGPKGLPIIGNLHQFEPLKPHIYFAKLAKTYGPILSLRFGNTPVLVVQSSKIAKEVLQTQDLNFYHRPSKLSTRRLTYNGLDLAFPYNNDYYREIKKICVVHFYSSKRVNSFAPIRQDEVLRMVNKVSTLSSASKIVNLSDLLLDFASSNLCRTAFGKRYDDGEGSKSGRIHSLLKEAQTMLSAFFFADFFPSMIGCWLDKLNGQFNKLEKTFKNLDHFYDEIINDHLDPERLESEQEDFIDALLHLRKLRASTFELTLDHIKALVMDTFVARTDTVAAMVVWAMTELILNPITMRKVQEELRNDTSNNKAYITTNDLPKFKYLKAVVKETLRLHPAAPLLLIRETLEKCSLEGYDILPKTLVFVNIWVIGRDPEFWKDPNKFMPERFLGSSIDFKGQDFEYIPFGAGRKMCPGILLGVANFELALANLLYSFDWRLPDGIKEEDIDTDTRPGLTMHKKNPLCLLARKYSTN